MLKNEERLFDELKAGSQIAFEKIYNEYYQLVNYIIFKIVNDNKLTRQLTIDTFINLVKYADERDRNKSLKFFIVNGAKLTTNNYLDNHVDLKNELLNNKQENQYLEILNNCCDILTEQEFDVLNFKIVYDCTNEEIARELKLKVKEVQNIYKKALEKLKLKKNE